MSRKLGPLPLPPAFQQIQGELGVLILHVASDQVVVSLGALLLGNGRGFSQEAPLHGWGPDRVPAALQPPATLSLGRQRGPLLVPGALPALFILSTSCVQSLYQSLLS